jgi:hypothetical protein
MHTILWGHMNLPPLHSKEALIWNQATPVSKLAKTMLLLVSPPTLHSQGPPQQHQELPVEMEAASTMFSDLWAKVEDPVDLTSLA